jgi:hypothetical protein
MITAHQFTFKTPSAYFCAIEAADIFNRPAQSAPQKIRPVPFNATALVRDLIVEEAEQSANKILKAFINQSSRNELFKSHTVREDVPFIGTIEYERNVVYSEFSYNFTDAESVKLRDAAFEVLCAFEFTKLQSAYNRKFRSMMRNPDSAPAVYKRYARALRDHQNEMGDWKLLAFILSSNADEHYDVCGTFPRTTETAFIKQMRAGSFGVKLTASDELHVENVERVAYENLYLIERVLEESAFSDIHAEAVDEDAERDEEEDAPTHDTDIDFEPDDDE